MKHIILVVGARPNFIKMAPVYFSLKAKNLFKITIIHTGQHYDPQMSQIFVDELNIINDIHYLDSHHFNSQCSQLGDQLIQLDKCYRNIKPDLVIVFGDVTSTLSGALAANKNGIPIAHVESGNRCHDRTMPEEINRILVDSISSFYFISEPLAVKNLINEGLIHDDSDNYWYVGNPMIDTLFKFRHKAARKTFYKRYGLQPNNYILLTLHRQSNIDDPIQLKKLAENIELLATKYTILYPAHHRQREKLKGSFKSENIKIIDPLGYIEFLSLLITSALVITDSGGIQEETTALKIPCITLRPNTERPITCTAGSNHLLTDISDPLVLLKLSNELYNMDFSPLYDIPLWDGNAGNRIADIIQQILCS